MIGLEVLYVIGGAFFAAIAVLSARDATNPKRWKNTAFWGLFAASFLFGSHLPDLANGLIVIAMVLVAGVGGLGRGAFGMFLFVSVLPGFIPIPGFAGVVSGPLVAMIGLQLIIGAVATWLGVSR